jgi:glycosyltransferase involved in cell wall biosynthesis
MIKPITVVQHWGGCPLSPNSKWQSYVEIVQRCSEKGWRNYIVWTRVSENPALVKPFKEAGCEIIFQPLQRREFDLTCVWRTYRMLRPLKCDIFHCYNSHTSPLIGAFLAGVPVRVWSKLSMSPYYEKNTRPKGLRRMMPSTRLSAWLAHRILAISNQVRQELVDTVGFGKKIDTVHVPVDIKRYTEATKGRLRHELGLDSTHILITTVGRAIPVKGWDIALRAFAEVQRALPCARLVLVGRTTSSEEGRIIKCLTDLSRSYRVAEYVHFLGYRIDIPEILKASDIFILPSRSEGMPAVLIEAMAAGLPCVAARAGGIPEVISHGEDGLLFERESAEELARHLISLIGDAPLRGRLAAQASKSAGRFSIPSYVGRVFECYESLLYNRRDWIT